MSKSDSPVGWCPRNKHGDLYLSRANGERAEVEADAECLGADNTLGAPELGPFTVAPLYTTPPAAAQDTGRLDWLEENGGRISGPADDSPRFVIWGDTDAQDVQGETLREAIDNAMDAARAAGGE